MPYSPKSVRPKRDWCLVLMEPRKTQLASGIFLPVETGAEKVTEGAAHVINIGNGEKAAKLGLRPGDRVVLRSYLKYANPVPTDEKWPDGTLMEYFLMSIDDVFSVIPEGIEVGVFSRPAVTSLDEKGRVR